MLWISSVSDVLPDGVEACMWGCAATVALWGRRAEMRRLGDTQAGWGICDKDWWCVREFCGSNPWYRVGQLCKASLTTGSPGQAGRGWASA